MRKRRKAGFGVLFVLVINGCLTAQEPDWKKETTKDGKVTVSYNFTEGVDQEGKKFNMLEYEAVTTAKATLKRCRDVMTDDQKHMAFMEGTQDVKRVRDLPGGEWITYYFLNSRWPMPDTDLITRYKLEEDPSGKRFILTGMPAPEMYPEGDVPRMKHNVSKYTFTDLGNGLVEVVMFSQSIPLVSVPNWLIATWIPDGPADMLNGIISLANEQE
jgi:hypothetical protein